MVAVSKLSGGQLGGFVPGSLGGKLSFAVPLRRNQESAKSISVSALEVTSGNGGSKWQHLT